MQIQLSDHRLLMLNAIAEAVDMVLPEKEWRAIPPFTGEGNPVVMAVQHGSAYGMRAFQRSQSLKLLVELAAVTRRDEKESWGVKKG